MIANSASRSRHGSKKRSQKTRSSLNIAASLPLQQAASMQGLVNGSVSTLPNNVTKSQKLAAQIYGSQTGG